MDKVQVKAVQAAENHSSSRGPSPSHPTTSSTVTTVQASQDHANGKKTVDGLAVMKTGRRKSPVGSRKHGEKASGASSSSTPVALLNAPGSTGNTHLSPVTGSAALPATPSSSSLLSASTDDRSHANPPAGTTSNPDASFASVASPVTKMTEEPDEDQDASYFSSGGDCASALDDLDGGGGSVANALVPGTPEYQKVQMEVDHIRVKILKTKDLIREEQTARDENVNEYLRLASQADKQQQIRLKAVFEKKNTKSSQQMQMLQRKLDSYQRRLSLLQGQGVVRSYGNKAPKQVLRGVGLGIKTVMAKPREFAHLIRNRFGSADNINHIRPLENAASSVAPEEAVFTASHTANSNLTAGNSSSLPGHTSQQTTMSTSTVVPAASQGSGGGKYTSEEGSECGSSVTSESIPGGLHMSPRHNAVGTSLGLDSFFQELQERREEVDRLREEMESVKIHLQQEVSFVSAALQEERFRVERLEEQINDLTELHQNEVENLKQNIADMEEKVQYQSEERLRDIHDLLDSCHTRISKVEHQAQHQQHVSLEGIENSNARAVLVKLINMALTLLQLVLVVVSTAANIIAPFLKTRLRVLSTFLLAFVFAYVMKQWPELVDLGTHLIQHYKAALTS